MKFSKVKLCSMLVLGVASVASAQVRESTSAVGLEEIIITAEKRETNLQETAIAVTALDAGLLERANIEDSLDLQFSVPNLMISGQNNGNFTIRGVGLGALGGGADPAVGQAFNTVPVSPSGEVYDLERIEVLRGPQGTLFGRNTTGGVINTVTAKPSDEFSVDITAQIANFDSHRLKGAINIPLTSSVSQRFAFYTVNRDGYTENVFNGTDVDGRNEYSIRSTTRFDFSDTANATLTVQYFDEDSDRQSSMKTACRPDPTIGCAVDTGDFIGYPADYFNPALPPLGGNINNLWLSLGILRPNRYADNPNPQDLRKVSIDTDPEFYAEETFATLEINIDLTDELTLTSTTGYKDLDFEQFRDWDLAAAPNAFFNTPGDPTSGLGGAIPYFYDGELQLRTDFSPVQRNATETEQISQEFRIASDYAGGFNFLAGISYFESSSDFLGITWIPSLHSPIAPVFGAPTGTGGFNTLSIRDNESIAIFGELYFDLNDDLTLTAGLRYTEDEQDVILGTNATGPVTAPIEPPTGEWDEVTGKLNLNWAFGDNSSAYVTLSRGYKGGGLNPGNPISDSFDPEILDAVEIGSKNRWFDNRMSFNAAAFYYDYQDYQVGGLVNGVATNFNADSVVVYGLEFETVYLVTDEFQVNLNGSFLDTEIEDSDPLLNVSLGTSDANSLEDVEGNELPNAPAFSFSLGAQYTQQLANDYQLRYRADYYIQDEFQGREFDNFTYDGWDRLDLYVNLYEPNDSWEAELFVKNALDDDGITSGVPESNLVGLFRKLNLLDPRTFGVEFTYRWK